MFLLTLLFGLSIDCPDMVNLAIGMKVNRSSPSLFSAIQNDCCNVNAVQCYSGRVWLLSWDNYGFDGYINETAIPRAIYHLSLANNKLNGSFPNLPLTVGVVYLDRNNFFGTFPSIWPPVLTILCAYSNKLSGFVSSTFPLSLISLFINGNRFTGSLPPLPISLKSLSIGSGNKFSGTLTLHQPVQVSISGNLISDIVISNITSITTCDLSNNPLLGNPNLVSFTMCTMSSLYTLNSISSSISKFKISGLATPTSADTFSALQFEDSSFTNSDDQDSMKTTFLWVMNNPGHPNIIPPKLSIFQLLQAVFRLLINISILLVVLKKTPFKREFKNMLNPKKKLSEIEV